MAPPHGLAEIKKFYGWEDKFINDLPAWEKRMVVVPPPPGQQFIFDKNGNQKWDAGEVAKGVRIHEKIADELAHTYAEINEAGLWQYVRFTAGGYAFRVQRGSSTLLSMHALGAADDIDAQMNPRGVPASKTKLGGPGIEVVRIFKRRGWTWGGEFQVNDAMHMQYGSGY